MVENFVKFPRTPYLAWQADKAVREDRALSPTETASFLRSDVVIEEKLDGANLGISVSSEGELVVQNRGSYIERPAPSQFQPLWGWLEARSDRLVAGLGRNLILFGEWCYAVHSIRYDRLPDWFIGFDIYDRAAGRFFSAERRNLTLASLQLCSVPRIAIGRFSMNRVVNLLEECQSAYGSPRVEGLYLRRESKEWLEQRAKIVRSEFTQAITEHWSSRPLAANALVRIRRT
jgi:ATP-dependent RNA circularization protein (DNA/RNA ligase family)